jgi:hypothetical protein
MAGKLTQDMTRGNIPNPGGLIGSTGRSDGLAIW